MLITVQFNDKTVVYGEGSNDTPSDSMQKLNKNNVVQVNNSKFYIPNYEEDLIQGCIYKCKDYFEREFLNETKKILPKNPTVIDIGANIGNHTLFWANECSAKKIYAFEPVSSTFKILKKNIKINNLQDRVKLYNAGLSEKKSKGKILSFDKKNIGGTRLAEASEDDADANIKLITLDSVKFDDKKIDLVKIDVEGMDYLVLTGAIKTLKKYKPLILIESFSSEFNISKRILLALGYKEIKYFGSYEYLFAYSE